MNNLVAVAVQQGCKEGILKINLTNSPVSFLMSDSSVKFYPKKFQDLVTVLRFLGQLFLEAHPICIGSKVFSCQFKINDIKIEAQIHGELDIGEVCPALEKAFGALEH